MPKKYTQKEADELDKKAGAIPIGKYNGQMTKREYQCIECGTIFLVRPSDVKNKNQTSCKKCKGSGKKYLTRQEVIDLDNKAGAIPVGEYIQCDIKREYSCTNCKKSYFVRPSIMWYKKQILCNKCSAKKQSIKHTLTQEQAEIIDKKLGTKPIGMYINGTTKRKYQCIKCNNIYYATPNSVRGNKQITCQQCSKKRVDNAQRNTITYVKQTILQNEFEPLFDDSDYINNKTKIKVRCKCGKEFKTSFNQIQRKITTSCGNYGLQRNGRFTSFIALRLHNLIEQITNQKWEHNYFINGKCFDIVNPKLKIVIEYDGYYNHKIRAGDKTQKDNKKISELIKSGWKVLRIKSNGRDIPTEKQLYKILLNDFQHNTHKRTITMKSWKDMAKQYESDRS